MADNATPTNATATPAWMHFVNFDGRLTGHTAQVVKQVAESRGISPQDLLGEILAEGLKAYNGTVPATVKADDVKVEPMTINAGNGGFHVVTVVADGYGSLVAEDTNGAERARVECQDPDEADENPGKDLADLMAEFTKVTEAERNA